MIGYRLQSDELAALQKRAGDAAAEVGMVAARAAAGLTRNHLYSLDTRANKLGGACTHFYMKAGDSVSDPTATGNTFSFNITKLGLAQRWLGGDIEAGKGISSATGEPTKFLAIPARAEAYGKPPSAFPDLVFVPRPNGEAMLVQALQTLVGYGKKGPRSRGERGGLTMYWLVEKVHQDPDPTVMPTEKELTDAAVQAGSEYLERSLAS